MIKSLFSRFSSVENDADEIENVRAPLEYVIVSKSAVERSVDDPAHLIQALSDFVTYMTGTAGYDRDLLPAGAIEAFHCHTYLTHVEAGGHAQFLGQNGEMSVALMQDVLDAMAGMKAKRHLRVAKNIAKWANKNAEVLADTDADILDGVFAKQDVAFLKAEDKDPLLARNARWIGGWPHLLIVEDAQLDEALSVAASPAAEAPAPEAEPAQPETDTDPVAFALRDTLHLAVGMAAARARPAEALIAIGDAQETDLDGVETLLWDITTTSGMRIVSTDDETGAKLQKKTDDTETEVGQLLSHVTIDELEAAQQMAEDLDAASMINALIEDAFPGATFNTASIGHARLDGNGQPDLWVIVTLDGGRKAFSVLLTINDATAFAEPTHELIAHIRRDQSAADLAEAA